MRMQKLGHSGHRVGEDKLGHIMLFCALLLVRSAKTTAENAINIVPLTGNAKILAEQIF